MPAPVTSPTRKTRTVNFDNRFQFLLWDYISSGATNTNAAIMSDTGYDLWDSKYVSFIARVDISNITKPNGDTNWYTLTSYTGGDIWKKGNAYNTGHRLADLFDFFGYTSSYFLWKYQSKSYAGGIFIQNFDADTYPNSGGYYYGKGPFRTSTADKIVYQGRSFSVGYTSNARATIGTSALDAASDSTALGQVDFMRHALTTMKSECDARSLAYPAYLAHDFESGISIEVGTDLDSLVQDVRDSNIAFSRERTGDGCASAGTVEVRAIYSDSYEIFIGGKFTSIDGVSANNVAKYSVSGGTASWSALGTGLSRSGSATNATVRAITVRETSGTTYYYVAGNFDSAGGTSVANVARFNKGTSTWFAMGTGITKGGSAANATVYAVVQYAGKIYFGGDFDSAGGVAVNNIASYDPSTGTWAKVGTGTDGANGIVYALTTYRKRSDINISAADYTFATGSFKAFLVVGGAFTSANAVANTSKIAAYSAGDDAWYALGKGVDDDVYALCQAEVNFNKVTGSETATSRKLIIGGNFTAATQSDNTVLSVNYVVAWTPTTTIDTTITTGSYSALGAGFNLTVRTLAQPNYSLDIFAGGDFSESNGNPMYYFARYDVTDSEWKSVSVGFDAAVYAIAPHTINGTYIGGAFVDSYDSTVTLNQICSFGDYTTHYDVADIVVNNRMNESPNRYETEIVYEEYNTSTRAWEGKTLKDAFTAAGFPTHVNSIAWQSSDMRDPKSSYQVNNRDYLRKMYPYFAKMNDWVMHKIIYQTAKEIFPGIRCGNYSHEFPLNGDIDNHFPGDPRNTFFRVPHESTNFVQHKSHFRADFQVPVCYSPNPNNGGTLIFHTTRNDTTTNIANNNGVALDPASDSVQRYYNYHPFGTTNQDIYLNVNKQRIKACTATSAETTRFTNLTCIPYAEAPYEWASYSDLPNSYQANEVDILELWQNWYQRGLRTLFIFNLSMTWYGTDNASRAASSVYGNNLTQSRLFYATVEDFMGWVKSQTGYIRGRNYDA